MAALVAGVLAKASERAAQAAGDGAFLTMGNNDNTTNNPASTTKLVRANPNTNNFTAFDVSNPSGRGILTSGGNGFPGLQASSSGTGNNPFAVMGSVAGLTPALDVPAAVAGLSQGETAMLGTTNTKGGIVGISKASIAAADVPTTRVGVHGVSDTGPGVQGKSTSNHGVFGQTSATAGTVVGGLLAAGLTGRTGGTIALYGYSDGPPNPSYAPVGAVGQCENGFGVWGLSSAGTGAASRPGGGSPTALSGVLGTSTNGLGMYAISSGSYALAADGNGPTTVGALIRGLGGAQAAVFVGNVEIQGHLTVSGGINGPAGATAGAAPADRSGARATVADGAEGLVTVGEGQLAAGRAEVRLAPGFAAALADERYHVFLTEYGDNNGLYVARRSRDSFQVRAKDSPTASSAFSYRVVARSQATRAAADQTPPPLHVPTIPTPHGVPTLPTATP